MLSILLAIVLGFAEGEILELTETFDAVDLGALPAGWAPAETNGKGTPGSWLVVGKKPSSGINDEKNASNILQLAKTENTGSTYNVLLSDAAFPSRLRMSVLVRADSGEEDQGGGLLWNARDENNYYVTRWNPLEDNLRIYRVVDGKRTMIFGSAVNVAPGGWHRLDVSVDETHVTVSLDNAITIACATEPNPEGGRIGFWTKADAATSFDNLWLRKQTDS